MTKEEYLQALGDRVSTGKRAVITVNADLKIGDTLVEDIALPDNNSAYMPLRVTGIASERDLQEQAMQVVGRKSAIYPGDRFYFVEALD